MFCSAAKEKICVYWIITVLLLLFTPSVFSQDCSEADSNMLTEYYKKLPFRFAALDSTQLYTINIPGSYFPEPAFYQTNKFARVVVDIQSNVQYVVLFNPESDQVDIEALIDHDGNVLTTSSCAIFPSVKFHMTNEIQRAAIGVSNQWSGIPGYDIEALLEELNMIEVKLEGR
jgi:hypothetical protein